MKQVKDYYLLHGFAVLVLASLLGCATQAPHATSVTYLGNCGFLYANEKDKVLVDPFGTEYGNFFHLPSSNTLSQVNRSRPPFDGIDLLLITHIHGDHYTPSLVEEFLKNNSNTRAVLPPQVLKDMQKKCGDFTKISAQIISPELKMNESRKLRVNDVELTVVRMQHGARRDISKVPSSEYTEYEKTENYGYIFTIGKKKVFHQGDGCLKLNEEVINAIGDVDFGHLSFFDWDVTSFDILKNKLHANWVIFMHGTIPGEEFKREAFKETYPKLIKFEKELDCKDFRERLAL